MLLKSFLYKALNKVCSADVTQVLFMHKRTFSGVTASPDIICRFLNASDLSDLADSGQFGIDDSFVADFENLGFRCIAAASNGKIAGVIFLSAGFVPARHNSGGGRFDGIAVEVPHGCLYLFKVDVDPEHRGKRINAAMITFAVDELLGEGLEAIVTTTDWTNTSFLKSAARLGFQLKGHASEFVFASTHLYQLPKPIEYKSGKSVSYAKALASDVIRFRRE